MRNRYAVSTRPGVRTFTGFSTTRDTTAFPPWARFPTAHLPFPVRQEQGRAGAEMSGLVCQMAGLSRHLALSPRMRISPHTAPMQKFRSPGGTPAWAWQPRRVARRGRIEWLCRVAARPMISGVREHGSGHHGTGSGAAFDHALVSSGIVLHACVRFEVCGICEVGVAWRCLRVVEQRLILFRYFSLEDLIASLPPSFRVA